MICSRQPQLDNYGLIPNGPYKSYMTSLLFHQYESEGRHSILDLGYSDSKNIRFYSNFCSKIHVAEFYAAWKGEDPGRPFSRELLDEVLGKFQGKKLDVIVTWDLLNYLSTPDLAIFGEFITSLSKRNTFLVCMVSIREHTPATPSRYWILDENTLHYQRTNEKITICPQHTLLQLQSAFPKYRLFRAHLLRNGIQELVFEHR